MKSMHPRSRRPARAAAAALAVTATLAVLLLAAAPSVDAASSDAAVYLNMGRADGTVLRASDHASTATTGDVTLSRSDAADVVSYLAGSSRHADLARWANAPKVVASGYRPASLLFGSEPRHVMVEAVGLDASDLAAEPSFRVQDAAADEGTVPAAPLAAHVASRVHAEYGAESSAADELNISVDEIDVALRKLEQWAATTARPPKFAAIRVSGIDAASAEYRAQVAKVKHLLREVAALPDGVSTSLVVSPAGSPYVSARAFAAAAAAAAPSLPAGDIASTVGTSRSNASVTLPVCFTSEAACTANTQSCSGRAKCAQYSLNGNAKCWKCACPTSGIRRYAGAACQYEDISTELVLTVGVSLVLAVVVVAGVGMLASAAPAAGGGAGTRSD
ncbi:hypothetical protein H9P43_003935 [Blastocladiella emersonii ATCC 22665]|nr:hypothetical protein H9P43_003935 [Blastocladiella emersonii ATCC 22665]